MPISKRAKVTSDKPAYKKKEKTDSGNYVWRYDEKHVEKRWKEKREKLKKLEKNIEKVRKEYKKDLSSDDDRERAIAAIVSIMDETAARVGNEKSAKESSTYGASTLKVKHVTLGNTAKLKFKGKGGVDQDLVVKDKKTISALKELVKGKSKDDYIFEIDGKKIWDRAVNRYLSKFDISAKDLRGFQSNRIMKEQLKKKDFKEALEETAKIVGHEASTLKNQYLMPELVEKHEKKDESKKESSLKISKRAELSEKDKRWVFQLKQKLAPGGFSVSPVTNPMSSVRLHNQLKSRYNISSRVRLNSLIFDAWRMISPFLPVGSKLTSGYRTREDQIRILRRHWFRHTGEKLPRNTDYKKVSKELGKRFNDIVDTPDGSPHRSGRAFDISGANLYQIKSILIELSEDPDFPVKLRKPLVEDVNNAVHVHILNAVYNQAALENKLRKKMASAPISKRAVPIDPQAWSYDPKPHRLMEHSTVVPVPSLSGGQHYIMQEQDMGELKELYEGVHTSENEELAMTYANNRASESDPPVVLEVEVSGMKPMADIDAQRYKDDIVQIYKEIFNNMDEMIKRKVEMYQSIKSSDVEEGFVDGFVNEIRYELENEDMFYDYDEGTQDVSEIISNQASRFSPSALSEYYADDDDFMVALSGVLSGKVDDNFAAYVINQYRYLEEIPDSKILAAYTFSIFDPNNLGDIAYENEEGFGSESPKKLTYEDISYEQIKDVLGYRQIWKNPSPISIGKIQYHGTTMSRAKKILAAFGFGKSAKISRRAEEDFLGIRDFGFGVEDFPGDWFGKSPAFLFREDEEIPEYNSDEISESEAKQMINSNADKFFYLGLHHKYRDLEAEALKKVIEDNPKFYFIFKYHTREEDEIKGIQDEAAEKLAEQDPRAFFYYHLHHKYPELGQGAIVHLIDTNPESYHEFGLSKDYPDYNDAANDAMNIVDPSRTRTEDKTNE